MSCSLRKHLEETLALLKEDLVRARECDAVLGRKVLGFGSSRVCIALCKQHILKVDVQGIRPQAAEDNVLHRAGTNTRQLLNAPLARSTMHEDREWAIYPRCAAYTGAMPEEFESLLSVFGIHFDIRAENVAINRAGCLILIDYQCSQLPDFAVVERAAIEHLRQYWPRYSPLMRLARHNPR